VTAGVMLGLTLPTKIHVANREGDIKKMKNMGHGAQITGPPRLLIRDGTQSSLGLSR